MLQTLTQAVGALAVAVLVGVLAARGTITGGEALTVIGAVAGYFIHAGGVALGSGKSSP